MKSFDVFLQMVRARAEQVNPAPYTNDPDRFWREVQLPAVREALAFLDLADQFTINRHELFTADARLRHRSFSTLQEGGSIEMEFSIEVPAILDLPFDPLFEAEEARPAAESARGAAEALWETYNVLQHPLRERARFIDQTEPLSDGMRRRLGLEPYTKSEKRRMGIDVAEDLARVKRAQKEQQQMPGV